MRSNAALKANAMDTSTPQGPVKELRALLGHAGVHDAPNLPVADITSDSREVRPGSIFFALAGRQQHGIAFAPRAAQQGAAAIVWDASTGVPLPTELPMNVPIVDVPHLDAYLGAIAHRFFGMPSEQMTVAGVTGTNGKTTTAYLLSTVMDQLGKRGAYSGTLGFGRAPKLHATQHTTPDCISVHRQLAVCRDDGATHIGMEVSSHALDQRRVDGVRFDTAVFTNLTHDHLDYHQTFAAYGAAKEKLFTTSALRHGVINVNDAFGRDLARRISHRVPLTVYSAAPMQERYAGSRQLFANAVRLHASGLEIDVDGSWGAATLRSRLIGEFNVDNLLATLAVLLGWNFPLAQALKALEVCVAPPGRMESLGGGPRPLAIVDYAHTPDALEKALAAARRHCEGKLWCVFGCGGERDARKRPVMGGIAERLADVVIVTDDNPRNEDGGRIVAQILAGIHDPARVTIERNRARAIERALDGAQAGDVVLVAGKGHEDYQIVGSERLHFSDQEVVREYFEGVA
jgi:UDP-N-acetylmuramoyl-L-alanyl-D-glutamate--2,6-diaminopimelate ligase